MDYFELAQQDCPPAIVRSVTEAVRGGSDEEEMLIFSEITGASLSTECAYAVVGYLAESMKADSSPAFRSNFIFLARRFNRDFARVGGDRYNALRQSVAKAISTVIDDITLPQSRGGMLDTLMLYRIDLRNQIDPRVDYRSLTQTGYLADWQFNEYAACMGDEEALERLAAVLGKSGAQDLRVIFTDLRGKLMRKTACLSPDQISLLARPYLRDNRVTREVDGDGPPVKHYARELLDML